MLLVCLLLFLPLVSFAPLSHASTSGPGLSHGPHLPAAVAAAPPIQRNLPFVVVWNMPTARCHRRHNIDLDLKDFSIVGNKRQRFQGQVIFPSGPKRSPHKGFSVVSDSVMSHGVKRLLPV